MHAILYCTFLCQCLYYIPWAPIHPANSCIRPIPLWYLASAHLFALGYPFIWPTHISGSFHSSNWPWPIRLPWVPIHLRPTHVSSPFLSGTWPQPIRVMWVHASWPTHIHCTPFIIYNVLVTNSGGSIDSSCKQATSGMLKSSRSPLQKSRGC
ncbi:hypothetical protein BDR06DRAFT_777382 [Suillus hirtellus]|nr:hypothetical protein BDR06DRAFT_777382 [Suillus hirtellus]